MSSVRVNLFSPPVNRNFLTSGICFRPSDAKSVGKSGGSNARRVRVNEISLAIRKTSLELGKFGAPELWCMAMTTTTTRNNTTGEITVSGPSFSVRVSEDGRMEIIFPERVIAIARFGKIRIESRVPATTHNPDEKSPRSQPTKRGSR